MTNPTDRLFTCNWLESAHSFSVRLFEKPKIKRDESYQGRLYTLPEVIHELDTSFRGRVEQLSIKFMMLDEAQSIMHALPGTQFHSLNHVSLYLTGTSDFDTIDLTPLTNMKTSVFLGWVRNYQPPKPKGNPQGGVKRIDCHDH